MVAINKFNVITDATGLTKDDIKISEPVAPRAGGAGPTMMFINDKSGGKFRFQLNEAFAPFGASVYSDGKSDGKTSVDISFRNMEDNPQLKAVYDFVSIIDELMIQKGMDGLLGAKKSRDVIEELYRKSIKHHPEGKYAANMKLGVTKDSSLFDKDKNKIDITPDNLPKGSQISLIFEISSAYKIGSRSYGVVIRLNQAKLSKSKNGPLPNFAFTYPDNDGDLEETEEAYQPYSPTSSEREIANKVSEMSLDNTSENSA